MLNKKEKKTKDLVNRQFSHGLFKTLLKSQVTLSLTLQEHQNILKNATISRDSDIENVLGQWKKYILKHPAYFSKDFWEISI